MFSFPIISVFIIDRNYDKYYTKALQIRRMIYDEFQSVFNDVDILLTPTSISASPRFSEFTSQDNRSQCAIQDVYTQPSNLAGKNSYDQKSAR